MSVVGIMNSLSETSSKVSPPSSIVPNSTETDLTCSSSVSTHQPYQSSSSMAPTISLPVVPPSGCEYLPLNSVITDSGSNVAEQLAVSAIGFDNVEELVWMGNTGGHVTSYYGYQLQKYTSFQVHAMNDIRCLLTGDFGLLSLTQDTLRLSLRRGLTVFNHQSELMKDMQSMASLQSGLVLMGGHQKKLIELDLERVKQVRVTDIDEEGCMLVRQHPKFVCCGDFCGKVTLRDPNTLKVAHTFSTHSVTLSDFDVHGNYLISCGYSNRHMYVPDRFLMVYDLRMMRAVVPIQSVFLPNLLRFVPAFSSRFCVVSQTGQFQILDASVSIQTPYVQNVDLSTGASVTAFDISNSGQTFAFSDNAGLIYLYGACDDVVFNNFSQPTEFADPIEPARSISIDDILTPYSIIPMINNQVEKLLSDLPTEVCKKAYRLPKPIDPQIYANMRMVGNICYAPNPGKKGRNEMPYASPENNTGDQSQANDSSVDVIPNRYLIFEPNYNKVSLDEYDFGRFNHSPFASLDSTLPNSYANNMIQALYYIIPLRTAILNHLCSREFCLTCELSFLFHMLDESSTQNPCQATNFLRALRQMPKASALSLLLPEDEDLRKKVNFPSLSQSWLRFMLHQIHSEFTTEPASENNSPKIISASSVINELFGLNEKCSYECKNNHKWEEEKMKYSITLSHPEGEILSFHELVKSSLNTGQSMSAFCDDCGKFQHVWQTRKINPPLPQILTINCALDHEKALNFWKFQIESSEGSHTVTKLQELNPPKKPCRYGANCIRADCKFFHNRGKSSSPSNTGESRPYIPRRMFIKCSDSDDLEVLETESEPEPNSIEYELLSIVSVIKKPDEIGKDNIVSAIKVDNKYFEIKSSDDQSSSDENWFLFNHFCINPVPLDEVLHMDLEWKLPTIIMYRRKDFLVNYSDDKLEIKNPITAEVFKDDHNLARGHRTSMTFLPLTLDEMPKKGDIIAVDAEFVTLNQAETEFRSDGTRSTIKPPQRSVARITCVRGSGVLEGHPFLDDYIATQDQVADYMTKFSGIQPGDLDITISSKHLTTLKATYLKLRFLIDTGCIFVGHGLVNDFRVINLKVPQNQIIDTVTLFQSPHFKRRVSLRFLAWHFMGEKIQSETHDSIEDAKTALLLYRKYEELTKAKRVATAVAELYDAGRNCGWKVPGSEEE